MTATTRRLTAVETIVQRADDLHRLALFLAERPALTEGHTYLSGDTLTVYAADMDHLRRLRRLAGGTFDKDVSEAFYKLRREFGTVELELVVYREKACTRVQTGTRIVKRPIMVQTGVETVEEPVMEWVCDERLVERP